MYSSKEEGIENSKRRKAFIARQNVIFEFGFFVAKLGRNRVCCIYKEGVSVPTDLNGFIYKKVDSNIEEVAFSILKDLRSTGMNIKL
jgi:predicted nucleotide-binding protein